MELQKCYGCGFGFPRRWIDSVTFYLIQPLNFEATEEIFIKATYTFNALVGTLRRSLKQLVRLWEGRFYWKPPWSYLMWQLLCIVKEFACKKIICVWTCLYPIHILAGTPWWQIKTEKYNLKKSLMVLTVSALLDMKRIFWSVRINTELSSAQLLAPSFISTAASGSDLKWSCH